jgi:Spy/CpxP family protein refolding chaperone
MLPPFVTISYTGFTFTLISAFIMRVFKELLLRKEIEMKNGKMVIGTLAAILLLGGTANAQPCGMPGGGGMDRDDMGGQRPGGPCDGIFQNMLPMMRMLDLTDDQREAVALIVEGAEDSIEAIRETDETGNLREEFLQMFSASSLSAAEVEAHLNGRLEAMKDMHAILAAALVEIHDVLTAEQLAALAELDTDSMEMPMGGNCGGRDTGNRGCGMGVHPQR